MSMYLQDELFRLEQQLRLSAAEELKQVRADADARQQAAVEETERRCEEIRQRDVAQARADERQKSQQEIDDLKRLVDHVSFAAH